MAVPRQAARTVVLAVMLLLLREATNLSRVIIFVSTFKIKARTVPG